MIIYFTLIWLVSLVIAPAFAQQNHSRGHPNYMNWRNQYNYYCCNNSDCGEMLDSEVREIDGHTEVLVAGQKWCQVQPWMYLKSGNAPDWSMNHACVVKNSNPDPCAWLMCFQPKPGT